MSEPKIDAYTSALSGSGATARDFWAHLASQEVQRKAREQQTREMKARPQYRVAQNDEPEPKGKAS
jgi:hypothetical protein